MDVMDGFDVLTNDLIFLNGKFKFQLVQFSSVHSLVSLNWAQVHEFRQTKRNNCFEIRKPARDVS